MVRTVEVVVLLDLVKAITRKVDKIIFGVIEISIDNKKFCQMS